MVNDNAGNGDRLGVRGTGKLRRTGLVFYLPAKMTSGLVFQFGVRCIRAYKEISMLLQHSMQKGTESGPRGKAGFRGRVESSKNYIDHCVNGLEQLLVEGSLEVLRP